MTSATPFKVLLQTPDLPDLGARARPGTTSEAELQGKLEALFRDSNPNAASVDLIRALVLLWHDHLDAGHEIAQRIDTPDGSFLHAIMHRREPDYGNAKYWFRRVGNHPSHPEIARQTSALLAGASAPSHSLRDELTANGQWNASAFVDACEAEATRPTSERARLLREIQRIEFHVLLEHFTAHV